MRNVIIQSCVIFLVLPLISQQQNILKEESVVVNIEIPVRVFEKGVFVDGLNINDFEVFEDGVPQKLEAVYMIKKDVIQRKDEKKKFKPDTERTFFLFFEAAEYDPRMGQAIDFFVADVLLPKDNLIAVTPMKTYRLKDKGLEFKTKPEIADELKGLIRKDVVMGSTEYRNSLEEIADVAKEIAAEAMPHDYQRPSDSMEIDRLAGLLEKYRVSLERLEFMREVDQLKLLNFATYLKNRTGQKYVFFFYQREFIPVLETRVQQKLESEYNDDISIIFMLNELFGHFTRDVAVDIEKVKKHFADASTSIHFLYISRPREHIPGVRLEEHSEDIFAPFVEMAKASGGFVESSANPEFLFKKAVEASENYYLLYYAPKEYAGDGAFKKIKVRVKGKGYKVVHRLGYFSN